MEINEECVAELARNIDEQGLLQPILVRPEGEEFEVVAGDRRYLAHKMLKREKIRCIVREMSDGVTALARATENLTRVDLTPLEEAAIYRDLVENEGMSIKEVAEKMGKYDGTVKRRMDILNMPEVMQKALQNGTVSIGVVEELWKLKEESAISYYMEFAVEHGITISIAKQWVKDHFDKKRREQYQDQGGGSLGNPFEPVPVYVPCDLCREAVEVDKTQYLRICTECGQGIKKAFSEREG
jgi:ParB family chromosome partitioning protein